MDGDEIMDVIARKLTLADFESQVGHPWLVDATPQPIAVRLDSADRLKPNGLGAAEPFILTFSTPWDALLSEGHYVMRARGDGPPLSVHLIPTQTPPGPRRAYHAVFN
ncbi:DUF6916 family protein [Brevundimonas sp. Root1279]|uniref:DUF6916 family protein n=1 Tax=Brevundimonas sp. Root1279 TaxID=1736443 RepID=UPI0006F7BFE0|nr:hypothetical protein [Brevundimonas sp. Root1279]KQW81826.1 hypothetical protein ASC65_11090 [Brevundimonas sp. Root1279]